MPGARFGRYRAVPQSVRTSISAGVVALMAVASLITAAPTATASGQAHGAAYMALGDSYAAGEGLGPYEDGTDVPSGPNQNMCHRSVSGAFDSLNNRTVLPTVTDRGFWACSGATTDEMTHPTVQYRLEHTGEPVQLQTVDLTTRYISVSVGGDDAGFGWIGKDCAQYVVNHGNVRRAPGHNQLSCADQLSHSTAALKPLESNLVSLYMSLLTRAPNAVLAVVGYPRVLPASYAGAPTFSQGAFCVLDDYPVPPVEVGMTVADAQQVDAFEQDLNATLQRAIADLNGDGAVAGRITYVDTYSPSVPHNCQGTTPNASVAALELSAGNGIGSHGLVSTATFHPTIAGQQMMATAVDNAFSHMTPPSTRQVLTIRRTSGDGEVTTEISGTTPCPTPPTGDAMYLVGVGAQNWKPGVQHPQDWFAVGDPAAGFLFYLSSAFEPNALPGTWPESLSCYDIPQSQVDSLRAAINAGAGPSVIPTFGTRVWTDTFSIDIPRLNAPVVTPSKGLTPGSRAQITDGGGCGPYVSPQVAQWSFSGSGLSGTVPVSAAGRWGPLTVTLPTNSAPGPAFVLVTCRAADPGHPDDTTAVIQRSLQPITINPKPTSSMNRSYCLNTVPGQCSGTTVARGVSVSMNCWEGGPQALGQGKWFNISVGSDGGTAAGRTGFVPAPAVSNQWTSAPRC
jgi:hypothetical protein